MNDLVRQVAESYWLAAVALATSFAAIQRTVTLVTFRDARDADR
ncbi:MAG: hypothetical protein ABL996_15795 [Micropepsaceae bacterium]